MEISRWMRASGDRAAAALGRRALERHLDGRLVDSRGRIVLPRERQPRRTFVGPLLIIGAAPARAAQLVDTANEPAEEGPTKWQCPRNPCSS